MAMQPGVMQGHSSPSFMSPNHHGVGGAVPMQQQPQQGVGMYGQQHMQEENNNHLILIGVLVVGGFTLLCFLCVAMGCLLIKKKKANASSPQGPERRPLRSQQNATHAYHASNPYASTTASNPYASTTASNPYASTTASNPYASTYSAYNQATSPACYPQYSYPTSVAASATLAARYQQTEQQQQMYSPQMQQLQSAYYGAGGYSRT